MKALVYISVIIAALLVVPMISSIAMAQSVPFDRNLCNQNCAWLKGGARGGYGGYMNYANCIASCDSQFWKDVDRITGDTEKSK